MSTPRFARTAIASAVSVALIGAPVALGAPAFGSTALTSPTQPAQSATDDTSGNETQPDDDSDHSDDDRSEEPSTLPAGSFAVRKATAEDTFALFRGGSRFVPDDPDFTHRDITVTLPNIDGDDRDFVLVEGSAFNIVTEDGLADVPYAPEANGNGDRTFAFDVAEDGTIGDLRETSPDPGDEEEDGDGGDNGDGESPSPGPTEPGPTPDPTPTGTPDPTPDPTRNPSPEPTDDPSDDGDDGGSDDDGDDSGSDDGPGSGDDLTEDPSTGNGSDGDSGSSDPAPTGPRDWVPTTPSHPDYTDPVPQPPGADGDDSITPDNDGSAPHAGDDDEADNIATDSAADEDGGAAMPWQIAVVVGIGAAAVGFILLVVGRRRAD